MSDLFTALAKPEPRQLAARVPAVKPGLDHVCAVCGGPAGFGFGASIRRGTDGLWSCLAHRGQVERMPR